MLRSTTVVRILRFRLAETAPPDEEHDMPTEWLPRAKEQDHDRFPDGRGHPLHAVLGGVIIAGIVNGMALLGLPAAIQLMAGPRAVGVDHRRCRRAAQRGDRALTNVPIRGRMKKEVEKEALLCPLQICPLRRRFFQSPPTRSAAGPSSRLALRPARCRSPARSSSRRLERNRSRSASTTLSRAPTRSSARMSRSDASSP